MAIGNVLLITPALFEIYRKQAVDARSSGKAVPQRGTECISTDLSRTFPTLAFFVEGGPMRGDCQHVLEAYAFYRPDIGYVQGMSYLAAMLLLYLPIYPAFVGFCNLLNSPSVLGLYRLEPQAVACRAALFLRLCSAQLPHVAECIEEAGLTPEMFLIEWFMTLYTKCLPIDVASVVWDLFLLDGEVVLYCAGIALLRMSEASLMDNWGDLQGCARVLGEELRQRVTDPDDFLRHLREAWHRAPPGLLEEIRAIERVEFASTSSAAGAEPVTRAESGSDNTFRGYGALTPSTGAPGPLAQSRFASWRAGLPIPWALR